MIADSDPDRGHNARQRVEGTGEGDIQNPMSKAFYSSIKSTTCDYDHRATTEQRAHAHAPTTDGSNQKKSTEGYKKYFNK